MLKNLVGSLVLLSATACCENDVCLPAQVDTDSDGAVDSDVTNVPEACVWFGEQPAFSEAAVVTGRVVSPSGTVPVLSAVAQAVVGDQVAWMLTQCGGRFSLELPPGTHDLTIQTGRYGAVRTITVTSGEQLDLGNIPLVVPDVKIAVLQGQYDDIGSLITKMGIPFDTVARPDALLDDAAVLATYDVVFANCGTLATTTQLSRYTAAEFANMRAWIEAGGTLYASDWEYPLFQGAVPEALDFSASPKVGPATFLSATVVDRSIQTMIGKDTVNLTYNLSGWVMPTAIGPGGQVLVEGTVPTLGRHPLAAVAYVGSGKAIFTTFHNETQMTDDMELLLYDMILSL